MKVPKQNCVGGPITSVKHGDTIQTRLKASGRYSSALGMDTTTIIALDTHHSMSQNGVMSIITEILKLSFGSLSRRLYRESTTHLVRYFKRLTP